jgi:hypothetical protein
MDLKDRIAAAHGRDRQKRTRPLQPPHSSAAFREALRQAGDLDSKYKSAVEKAESFAEKSRLAREFVRLYPKQAAKSEWLSTLLDIATHMQGHAGLAKKAKTLKPSEITALLLKARQEPSRVDWSILTPEQEKCAILRWKFGCSVSLIARSMGKHRTTVDELLVRAEARLKQAVDHRKRRAKRSARDEYSG